MGDFERELCRWAEDFAKAIEEFVNPLALRLARLEESMKVHTEWTAPEWMTDEIVIMLGGVDGVVGVNRLLSDLTVGANNRSGLIGKLNLLNQLHEAGMLPERPKSRYVVKPVSTTETRYTVVDTQTGSRVTSYSDFEAAQYMADKWSDNVKAGRPAFGNGGSQ